MPDTGINRPAPYRLTKALSVYKWRVQMAQPPTKDQQAHTCQSRRQEEPYGAYAVWRKGNLRESIGTRKHEMGGTSSLSYSLVK